MKVTMEIRGIDALKRAVAQTPEVVNRELAGVVQVTSFGAAQRAKALVPVATGTLRREISAYMRGQQGGVQIGAAAFYWRFVEYGTVKMAARPFLRPAAEAEFAQVDGRLQKAAARLEKDWRSGGGLL